MIYTHSLYDVLAFQSDVIVGLHHEYAYYGSISEADRYLCMKKDYFDWEQCDWQEKALVLASRQIDDLRFHGTKTDILQELEFPRNGTTTIPENIKKACFELAFMLIHDVDPEIEIQNQRATSLSYSGIRTTHADYAQDHVLAGIPSAKAWAYLRPYLVHPGNLTLSRET